MDTPEVTEDELVLLLANSGADEDTAPPTSVVLSGDVEVTSDTDSDGTVTDATGKGRDDDDAAEVETLEADCTVETGRTNVLVSSRVCVWLILSPSTTTVEVSRTVSVSMSTTGALSTGVLLAATSACELVDANVVGRADIFVSAPLTRP